MMWRYYMLLAGLCLLGGWSLIQAQDEAVGRLRFAHLSLDAGPVGIALNDDAVGETWRFGDFSDWLEVPAQTHEIVFLVGDGIALEIELSANDWVTVALIGYAGNDSLYAHYFYEDHRPMAAGETRVGFLNVMPDQPPVNVQARDVDFVRLLGYPTSPDPASDGYISLDLIADLYAFVFVLDEERRLEVGERAYRADQQYLIVLAGASASPQVFVRQEVPDRLNIELEPTPVPEPVLGDEPARLRFAHLSPGTPPLDFLLDDEVVAQLAFPQLGNFLEVEAGVVTVRIASEADSLALPLVLPVDSGAQGIIAAIGLLEGGTLQLHHITERRQPLAAGLVRIGLFNTVSDSDLLTLRVIPERALIQGLAYPGYFYQGDGYTTVDILAGDYALSIEGNQRVLITLDERRFSAGQSYLFILTGLAGTATFILDTQPLPSD